MTYNDKVPNSPILFNFKLKHKINLSLSLSAYNALGLFVYSSCILVRCQCGTFEALDLGPWVCTSVCNLDPGGSIVSTCPHDFTLHYS